MWLKLSILICLLTASLKANDCNCDYGYYIPDYCGEGYWQCRRAGCTAAAIAIGIVVFAGIGAALIKDGSSTHCH